MEAAPSRAVDESLLPTMTITSIAIAERSPLRRAERRNVPALGTGRSRSAACIRGRLSPLPFLALAILILAAAFATPARAATADSVGGQALEIERSLYGFPKRAQEELGALLPRADAAPPAERRHVYALFGQAAVAAGNSAEALALADRLEREATTPAENSLLATALLLRATAERLAGDAGKASTYAKDARRLLSAADDPYLSYWAAMSIGVTARNRGHLEEAVHALQEALSLAEQQGNAYRRAAALYQLSTLYVVLKQPQGALDASLEAYRLAEAAGSTPEMVKARMAESSAHQALDHPKRELEAMEEALALARKSRSQVGEGLALINLADIKLRRKDFNDALNLSRQSLALGIEYNDIGSIATSKANIGFALFGLGKANEGRRYADEAVAEYERTGATAEIAELLGEYGHYLEKAGDYRNALVFYHRERKLNDEMAAAAHQRAVLELQEKYESDKRRREIELLNRQNELNSAELENRQLRERVWWLFAAVVAIALFVLGVYYQRLRINNGLLAQKNRELSARSSRDPLTSLYNRRYFQDLMHNAPVPTERRVRSEPDSPVHALLLIDIDLFKQTNDRFGHAAGDAVLVAIARRLRETLRETDIIVRWGGEEFLVFVPSTSGNRLDEIAARVMRAIALEPILYRGDRIHVTASIGYAPMPLPPEDVHLPWERAVSLVDMALYMAKLHGRNCAYGIRKLRRSDDEAMARIERNLESAWANGMVEMHLEPGPEVSFADNASAPDVSGGAPLDGRFAEDIARSVA
jgi:diguanylate cyclase (GGDEF)-like protein